MSTEQAIEDALEQAVIAFIADTGTHGITLGITARQEFEDDTDTLTLPAVVVKAERITEMSPATGNFQFRVTVTLKTQADDTTEATQRTQWHNLCSILMWDGLDSALVTSSLGINARSVLREEITARTEIDRHWEQVFTFTVWAYAI